MQYPLNIILTRHDMSAWSWCSDHWAGQEGGRPTGAGARNDWSGTGHYTARPYKSIVIQYLYRNIQFSRHGLFKWSPDQHEALQTAQFTNHNTGITQLFSRRARALLGPLIQHRETRPKRPCPRTVWRKKVAQSSTLDQAGDWTQDLLVGSQRSNQLR